MISANRTVSRRRGSAVAYRAETFSAYRRMTGNFLFLPPNAAAISSSSPALDFSSSLCAPEALESAAPAAAAAAATPRPAASEGEIARPAGAGAGAATAAFAATWNAGARGPRSSVAEVTAEGGVRRVGRTFRGGRVGRAVARRADDRDHARLLVFVEGDAPRPIASTRAVRPETRRPNGKVRRGAQYTSEADAISLYTRFTTRHTAIGSAHAAHAYAWRASAARRRT